MTLQQQKQRGFSLLELNCALFIILFGLFGMMQLYRVCIDKTRGNQEEILALRVLENELESLRALPFDALELGERQAFENPIPQAYHLVNATGHTRIVPYTEGGKGIKEVTVLLRWTGEYGRTRQQSLTTLRVNREASP